ncbi:hypothetical protein CW731_15165 [Polaribacter sp. ALD11]|uniref:T9SS type A sorting domain-containing protein n=1 Tax=Polaribacter sp. ALD11 TaxID=2058137 RepID=UPI000C311A23|nr:T9SS type A sorting domain-containing protein [Polaribacter sp. ALD11]AUC86538.1 hypothetical protein CW731_15165 [Polaribacter sp. ALD11]
MKKITFLILTFLTISLFAQTKLTSSLSESMSNNTWVNSSKQVYSYDINGNLATELYDYWDQSNSVWIKQDRYSYVYSSGNKLSIEIEENWDSSTNSYKNGDKSEYSYNNNGRVVESISYEWKNAAWEKSYKFSLTYNASNNIDGGYGYNWNGGTWVLEDKSLITYNANNKISKVTVEDWNGTAYVKSDIRDFSYDASNKLLIDLTKIWNGTMYVDEEKTEYTYDVNGNVTNEKNSYIENGSWVVGSNESVTFDTSKLMSSFTHPFIDRTGLDHLFTGNPYVNKILTSSYTNSERTTYYYGGATASIDNFSLLNFAVYPNPTTSILKIDDTGFDLKNIEVFNIIGKKVLTSTTSELSLGKLVNGIYMLKIQDKNGAFAIKKVVKN